MSEPVEDDDDAKRYINHAMRPKIIEVDSFCFACSGENRYVPRIDTNKKSGLFRGIFNLGLDWELKNGKVTLSGK